MVQDADQLLDDYLSLNPAEQKEWEQTQKLRCDPRVIRGGDFLRKFSIDELPQIFNVLLGEMSLVGPRPMMADQVKLYGENIEAYCAVRPGITGLWQVSGRNHTTFQERARFDRYYIHNWSLWLDMYILTRTVWVVLSRDGAY
jgi:lipopolysaccharide/colanic/teichoic acid biosynthesis glycosyltransferase